MGFLPISRFLLPTVLLTAGLLALGLNGCASRGVEADHASVPEPSPPPAASPTEAVRPNDPSLLAGIPGAGPLTAAEVSRWLAEPTMRAPLELILPDWLQPGAGQVKDLAANPLSRAKTASSSSAPGFLRSRRAGTAAVTPQSVAPRPRR